MKRTSWFAPRLRTVLLLVNLTVLVLPLGGIVFLQIYENEIIRQKEAALLAQGAYVSTMFRRELLDILGVVTGDKVNLAPLSRYGLPIFARRSNPYSELGPTLDLRNETVREPLSSVRRADLAPEPAAEEAGGRLAPILFRAQTMTLDTVRVVDVFANVVASTQGEIGVAVPHWEEVQRALQGRKASLVRLRQPAKQLKSPLDALGLRPDLLVSVSLPIIEQDRVLGAVVLTGVPSRVGEVLYGNRGTLLSAFGLLLFIAILLAVITSLTISEPLQKLIKVTGRIGEGQFDDLDLGRKPVLAEMRVLNDALKTMALTLRTRTEYIRSFARNVSHEFKTPLTAIRGAVEVLQEHGESMSPERRERFLANLDADAKRLDRMTGRLLDMAKAEAPAEGGCTDLVLAAQSIVDRFVGEGMAIEFKSSGKGLVPLAEDDVASILVNLIENVRQHGTEAARATISVDCGPTSVRLICEDDGPGISEANLRRVLDPFFTTARNQGGTGLGLAIIKALVEGVGGHVSVSSEGRGAVVSIELPNYIRTPNLS